MEKESGNRQEQTQTLETEDGERPARPGGKQVKRRGRPVEMNNADEDERKTESGGVLARYGHGAPTLTDCTPEKASCQMMALDALRG